MKVFYAGANDKYWVPRILAGLSLDTPDNMNMLTTYYQMNKGEKNNNFGYLYKQSLKDNVNWIVDSGLFTMMFGAGKNKQYGENDLLEYAKNYIEFMNDINYKHSLIEMDVHKILGISALHKMRLMFEKDWDIERTIFVWHIEEGIEGLIALANKYPYIAISIPELRILATQNKQSVKNMIYSLFHIIRKNTKEYPKIHLLGCTQWDLMMNSDYYSVDSTTWQSGVRYNQVLIFLHNKLVGGSLYGDGYKKYRQHFTPIVINLLKAYIPKYNSNTNINNCSINCALQIYSSRQMENYINNRFYNNK